MVTRVQDALAARRNAAGDREKGFTLIELLVVVLIIGVLAAIAIPIYLGQQDTAKENATIAQITNAKTAVVAQLVKDPVAGNVALTAAKGFTPSDSITTTLSWVDTTDASKGFCIAGVHDDGQKAAIDDTGAAKKDGICTAGKVA